MDDSNCIVSIKGPRDGISLTLYDIYGQQVDSAEASENIVRLTKRNGYVVVALSRYGEILDRATTILK